MSDLENAVVLISSADTESRNSKNIGTGFVIHRDNKSTYVLTCAHVVEDVGGKDKVLAAGIPAEMVALGEKDGFDLAVLKVAGLPDKPILKLSTSAQKGDIFNTFGYYLFGTNKVRRLRQVEGKLNDSSKIESRGERVHAWDLKLTKGQLKPGYSGAPVFCESTGYVLGIVTHLEDNGARGLAISIEALAKIWSVPSGMLILPSFSFDVVTVDKQGKEKSRYQGQAQFFAEELGEGVKLEMVAIPGGTFLMGTDDKEIERLYQKYKRDWFRFEKPQHQVSVTSFFMGKYPVTQAQWKRVTALPKSERDLKSTPSRFKGDNRPVQCVSWYDAVEFCQRLSQATRQQYRLPGETEWEYACRAGTTTPFHFGETVTTDLANYNGNYTYADEPKGIYRRETTPVDNFSVANAFGLFDMHGNVWEWCADHWNENYKVAPGDDRAWLADNNSHYRLLSGGSWLNNPVYCRSAIRAKYNPDFRNSLIGFRVVCLAPRTL